ncbi:esterase/lipase family protein [Acetobacter conturbans]|uniref:Alpha/beta fold hydrolase n=1 Tax=Acetobacter conturbans TaxID=1737472 RepID=A0ABX0K1L3_9PROT|nr:alpha/beta fold hydrolase [Acetobacter conturbans]NHN89052.1 alpha/beta fold hydrolase [Acetobacter conturbans]
MGKTRRTVRRGLGQGLVVATVLTVLSACSPVSIQRLSLIDAYHERNVTALGYDRLSTSTRTVLQRQNLLAEWKSHPEKAIASLRIATQTGFYAPDFFSQLFALAELDYLVARQQHDRARFMMAALYAYAYLAPDASPDERPSPYDERFRQACDMYMLSLTEAFGTPAHVESQNWTLPIGTLELTARPADLNWHGHTLTDFRPTARLDVKGLNNIYTQAGLGEPLAAVPKMNAGEVQSFQVTDKVRVPVDLFMEIPHSREQVLSDHISGHLVLTANDNAASLTEDGDRVPLQYDPTVARSISLSDSIDWAAEYTDFLNGSYFDNHRRLQLAAIEPHKPGRMPVVLVHGTASSPARWANMINDLLSDSEIRRHFEFWVFSYGTGNPIPYSAMQLRESLTEAISNLGGVAADPALGHITVVGHSQGGLLAKMLVINAGDRLWNGIISTPLDQLSLSAPTRDLLREALFPAPMPEIRNVVFISTPQHGSFLATLSISRFLGRMMTFPLTVTHVTNQLVADNAALRLDMSPWRVGSVYGMSPQSRFIKSLAAIEVAPDVEAHSIIPVLGDGPLADQTDGIVRYESAHVPYVNSELVVHHSDHSTQSNAVTISEVRRILFAQITPVPGDSPPPDGIEKRNIIRIGGQYVPTQRPWK